MSLKKILAGFVITGSMILPASAHNRAEVARTDTIFYEDHMEMLDKVRSVGITVEINPKKCGRDGNTYGWYNGAYKQLVICQVNGIPGNGVVAWTYEDLNTIRHEAHHMVQDCMDSRLDGRLGTLYEDAVVLIQEELSLTMIQSIINTYSDYDEHRQFMELEAFAVAGMNSPSEQLSDIQRYCL